MLIEEESKEFLSKYKQNSNRKEMEALIKSVNSCCSTVQNKIKENLEKQIAKEQEVKKSSSSSLQSIFFRPTNIVTKSSIIDKVSKAYNELLNSDGLSDDEASEEDCASQNDDRHNRVVI
jgi:glutamyl-tRNA reductase